MSVSIAHFNVNLFHQKLGLIELFIHIPWTTTPKISHETFKESVKNSSDTFHTLKR